jgi:hypothetical protein
MIKWRLYIACCVPKATNTHSLYVILFALPLQLWLHKRAPRLCFTYIACFIMGYGHVTRSHHRHTIYF